MNSLRDYDCRPNRRTLLTGFAAAGVLNALAPSRTYAAPVDTLNLEALESRHGGNLGLYAEAGPRRVTWRGDRRFPYCSTFKLFLAACTLERVQRGLERIDRPVQISLDDMVSHAPITGTAVGATLTVEQLCKATVEVSDNVAANLLIRAMGGLQPWQSWYRSIGDNVTRVDRYETELGTAILGDARDTTTPEQFVANLNTVLRTKMLSPVHLSLLEKWIINSPTGPGRIKSGVPAGYRVGHKTGTGPHGTHNDIGIIWPTAGAPITIAVFFTGGGNASPDQLDAVLAESSRIALMALGHGAG
jgi:beta-lactamase class A